MPPDPIRLVPGKRNADAPPLTADITADQWCAWLTIERDRATDQPSTIAVLADALGLDTEPAWTLWWDRAHRGGGGLTHRATTAGMTLFSVCGYSAPAAGTFAYNVAGHPARDPRRTYCALCGT